MFERGMHVVPKMEAKVKFLLKLKLMRHVFIPDHNAESDGSSGTLHEGAVKKNPNI